MILSSPAPSVSQSEQQLRDLVRTLVVEALQRAGGDAPAEARPQDSPIEARPASFSAVASPRRRLGLLLTGRDPLSDDFLTQLPGLLTRGYAFALFLSASFEAAGSADPVAPRLPADTPRHRASQPEADLITAARTCDALIAPRLSANTAAKLAHQIDDSLPALLLRDALLNATPVFVAEDLPALERHLADRHPRASQALLRATIDVYHRTQTFGVRFIAPQRLVEEIDAAFFEPVNETPARLAKSAPAPKRAFVTSEDIWSAVSQGLKELAYPAGAIITDAARDEASARGITLRETV